MPFAWRHNAVWINHPRRINDADTWFQNGSKDNPHAAKPDSQGRSHSPGKNLSFSEVARQAIDAYIEHEELLEAMVEMAINLTQEPIKKIDALTKRMDKTHAMLKERSGT